MIRILFGTLFFVGLVVSVSGQQTISGTVTDADGQPLPSVSVKVVGSSEGTITDVDGKYRISVPDDYAILIFSGEGLETQEIHVNSRSVIDVEMKAVLVSGSSGELTTGYGSQSKESITGNVASVSGEAIRDNPVSNLESSLGGRTAGVRVQAGGVQVRGSASLTASNQPLYVVDGVPLASGSQSNINPANIKSMEILKDASASAIYGTRAANGVVVITTHSGTNGKMQIEADYQFGISQTPKKLDLLTAEEYNQQVIEFRVRQLGLGDFVTKTNLLIWQQILTSTLGQKGTDRLIIGNVSFGSLGPFYDSLQYSTDWQDAVFQSGISQRATVSAQGGTEKFGYYVSAIYNTREGILIGSKADQFNGLVSLSSQVSSKLSAKLSFNYIYGKDNRLREDQDLGAPLQALALPPSDQADPSNNYYLRVSKLLYNPLTEVNFSDNIGISNGMIGSLGLTYEVNDQLSLDLKTGIDFSDQRDEIRLGPETRDGGGTFRGTGSGRSQLSTGEFKNFLINGWATYRPSIGDQSKLSVILGGSYEQSTSNFTFRVANVNGISELEGMDDTNPLLQESIIPGGANAFVSSFARINYSYRDRYLLQVSGRRDGSSKFPENNRFGTFLAVSGGWILSEESFFSTDGFIKFLKIKASYGGIGNTPPGDKDYRRNFSEIAYDTLDGYRLINPANFALKWESTSQLNVGLEYSLGGRVSGSFDYYKKSTNDLLFPVPVSPTSGFFQVTKNGGSMTNSGFEIGLSSTNMDRADWNWTTDFNITFSKNKVEDLGGQRLILGSNAFLEGYPASVFYLRKYAGVDPDNGDALYDDGNGGTTNDWENAPRSVVGDPNPGFYGGLTNSVSYKNFDLSFMVQFVGDVDVYYATGEFLSNSGILGLNQLASQRDRWYEVDDVAKYPRLNPFQTNTNASTRWLEDGSFARLTNVIFTYHLPQDKVEGWGLTHMEVYIGGQNLWTLSNYTGYDPEVNYIDPTTGVLGQNINKGIDNFTAPQPRIFTTGIKIGL